MSKRTGVRSRRIPEPTGTAWASSGALHRALTTRSWRELPDRLVVLRLRRILRLRELIRARFAQDDKGKLDRRELTSAQDDRAKGMIKAVRGTRDLLPPETALWNFVEAAVRDVFRAYNFQEIRTPIFEETELFRARRRRRDRHRRQGNVHVGGSRARGK